MLQAISAIAFITDCVRPDHSADTSLFICNSDGTAFRHDRQEIISKRRNADGLMCTARHGGVALAYFLVFDPTRFSKSITIYSCTCLSLVYEAVSCTYLYKSIGSYKNALGNRGKAGVE